MATFYVSPTGNDSAAGTSPATAFKTLAKAQAAMAASSAGDTTIISGGTYAISTPVAMKAANSGDTLTAAAGQKVVLDGGGRKESLVTVTNASDVTISGLTLQNTTPGGDNDAAPAAISISGGAGDVVSGNTFTNVGKGVEASDGAHGLTVSNSSFSNVASTAVHLGDGTYGNAVTNSTMTHIGYGFGEGGAIEIYGSSGNAISHNAITDTAYHGIDEENYGTSSKTGGNAIEDNVLKNTVQTQDDGGAIYSFSKQTSGDVIRDNSVSGTGGNPSWGIYLDDYVSNDRVYGNFVTGARDGGVMIHGGSNNQVYDNVMVNSQDFGMEVMAITDDGIASTNNAIYHNVIQAPANGSVIATDPVVPSWFHDNVYVSPDGNNTDWGYDGGTLAQWFAMGGDKGSVVVANPGFVNAAAGNYSFAADSVALQMGIQQLPWTSMGLTTVGSSGTGGSAGGTGGSTGTGAGGTTGTGGTSSGSGGGSSDPPPPVVTKDTLLLQLSGDAYRGAPQFVVKVDGKQLAAPKAVTASHDDGQVQSFTFQQDWSSGPHTVEIDFVNDLWNPNVGDRNLWVNNVHYDGQSYGPSRPVALFSNSDHFVVTVGH